MRQLSDNAVSGGQQTWNCEQVSSQVSFLRGRRSSPNTCDSWPSTGTWLDQTNSDNWEIMRQLSDNVSGVQQTRNCEQVRSQVLFLRGRRSSPSTCDSWPSTRAWLDLVWFPNPLVITMGRSAKKLIWSILNLNCDQTVLIGRQTMMLPSYQL